MNYNKIIINEVSISPKEVPTLLRRIMVGSYINVDHGPRIKISGLRKGAGNTFISLFKIGGKFIYKYGSCKYDQLNPREKKNIETFYDRYELLIKNNWEFNYNRNPKSIITDDQLKEIIRNDENEFLRTGKKIIRDQYGNIIEDKEEK